jgi:pilus assembly protein Flp/PilA
VARGTSGGLRAGAPRGQNPRLGDRVCSPAHDRHRTGVQRRKARLVAGILATLSTLGRVWRRSQDGQGLAEYAMILALIAIVAIGALVYLGSDVTTILSTVGNSVANPRHG